VCGCANQVNQTTIQRRNQPTKSSQNRRHATRPETVRRGVRRQAYARRRATETKNQETDREGTKEGVCRDRGMPAQQERRGCVAARGQAAGPPRTKPNRNNSHRHAVICRITLFHVRPQQGMRCRPASFRYARYVAPACRVGRRDPPGRQLKSRLVSNKTS